MLLINIGSTSCGGNVVRVNGVSGERDLIAYDDVDVSIIAS